MKMKISEAWESAREFGGIANGYEQSIDADQAVNEDGKALYARYYIIVGDTRYEYSAKEMEKYAETW